MSKKVNYIITDLNITVNYDGQTHIVSRKDGLADRLIKAIKEKNLEEIPLLVSAAKRIETFSKGKFIVKDGEILVNGIKAPIALGNKILKFSEQGLPYEPLINFAAKLQDNPSHRAVNELFQFLEKNDHPITESGNFIAYKRVRGNFKDIHSGTFDNSVGKVVKMARNQVDEDPNRTCSNGLHVANWDYAYSNFYSESPQTDIMLEVEVNPAHVVAVPTDYNQSKMRVCEYKVLGVVDQQHSSDMQIRKVDTVDSDIDDSDDERCCSECGDYLEGDSDYCADCEQDYWESELG